jgi:hypothetical protein
MLRYYIKVAYDLNFVHPPQLIRNRRVIQRYKKYSVWLLIGPLFSYYHTYCASCSHHQLLTNTKAPHYIY